MDESTTVGAYLATLCKRIPGVIGVLVNHHQGPELLRAVNDSEGDVSDTIARNSELAAAFGTATEHLSKMEMGKNRSLVAFCGGVNVVHLSDHPLVVTFVAHEEAAIGLILDMADEVLKALEPLKNPGK
eukprot:TRINITY_DN9387_c0_g1_i1.p1 TRINITY_DN9387_c0_g1~~TRINITY_DN9387_c0_g1_i1.p1  ORF type:complete len:129 (+),score=34.26 TRINITY_DN9387_c0_g1_i1:202-588(+)